MDKHYVDELIKVIGAGDSSEYLEEAVDNLTNHVLEEVSKTLSVELEELKAILINHYTTLGKVDFVKEIEGKNLTKGVNNQSLFLGIQSNVTELSHSLHSTYRGVKTLLGQALMYLRMNPNTDLEITCTQGEIKLSKEVNLATYVNIPLGLVELVDLLVANLPNYSFLIKQENSLGVQTIAIYEQESQMVTVRIESIDGRMHLNFLDWDDEFQSINLHEEYPEPITTDIYIPVLSSGYERVKHELDLMFSSSFGSQQFKESSKTLDEAYQEIRIHSHLKEVQWLEQFLNHLESYAHKLNKDNLHSLAILAYYNSKNEVSKDLAMRMIASNHRNRFGVLVSPTTEE